jgi:DNA mismatch repair protein PMS2
MFVLLTAVWILRLDEYDNLIFSSGLTSIEVSDNGSGIRPEDYDVLAVKHTTSKIAVFSDLECVQSFGFRGEALSSLCAVGDGITVSTRTANQAVATKLVYDRNGVLVSRSPCARKQGTTVVVTKLFSSLPVRLKDFELNKPRELHRTIKRVQVILFRSAQPWTHRQCVTLLFSGLRTCLH